MFFIKNITHFTNILLGLMMVCTPLLAQQQSTLAADSLKIVALTELVVTATRSERSLSALPVLVQIIEGKTIRQTGASRLSEIIQEQTGLVTVPDFGGGQGVQLQGLDAAYTLILIDGQPMIGRSAGTLDLARITVNNIERIEVLKGASSCLYGSEALAGVINIITKKPSVSTSPQLSSQYKYGTFDTHDVHASVAYGKNKVGVELFGNYYQTNGYDLSDNGFWQTVEPFHSITLQPKLKYLCTDKFSATFYNRFFYQNQRKKALVNQHAYEGASSISEWNSSVLMQHIISEKWQLTYDLYVTQYNNNEHLNDPNDQLAEASYYYHQWYYRPEVRTSYKLKQHTLSAGVGLNNETLNRTYFGSKASLQSEYFFGQFEWFIKKRWNVLTGFRYDHHRQYRSQFSPKLGVNYQHNSAFSVKASVGYGYKAPDLRQLYFDFTNSAVGYTVLGYNVVADRLVEMQQQGQILFNKPIDLSQALKPESSVSTNVGLCYKKYKYTLEFNLFYNNISNLIETQAVAQKVNGQQVFSYINLKGIFTYGLEWNATYRLSDRCSLVAGYQYLAAKDQQVVQQLADGEVFARDPITLSSFQLKSSDYHGLFNRSNHTINLKVNYELKKLQSTVAARLLYRSKFGVFDTNGNAIFDKYDDFAKGYCTLNLTLDKVFKYGLGGQIGANNLFNYTDAAHIPNLAGRQLFVRVYYNL